MIIAVDGPTASGKGTIAKALADHYGLPHLDTGLLYRAVGRQLFVNGGDPDDGGDALAATAKFAGAHGRQHDQGEAVFDMFEAVFNGDACHLSSFCSGDERTWCLNFC